MLFAGKNIAELCEMTLADLAGFLENAGREANEAENKIINEINRLLLELINIGLLLFFLLLVIFIGGVSLPYYSLPTNIFVLFGFVPFCYIIEKFMKGKIEKHTHGRDYGGSILDTSIAFVTSIAALILGVLITVFTSINPKVMNITADELWLFKFRDYIADSGVQDPGIMNMYCLDAGLYTVLNEEPICYYYQTQTLNMQEVLDHQKQYLHSGEADFVLSCDAPPEGLGDRYDLVMKEKCVFYDFEHVYYLYQRNDTPADEG